MMHPAEASAREKLRRAERHLAELHGLVSAYCDSRPYRVMIDPPGDKGVPIGNGHRVLSRYEPPPPSVSAVAGDVVTNLRSTLDHVVWGLANPKRRGTHTKFPIHHKNTTDDARRLARALEGVKKPAVTAIKKMQPYHGPGEPRDRPLAVLNELVNEDKHRNILTVRVAVPFSEFFGPYEKVADILSLPPVAGHPPIQDMIRGVLSDPAQQFGNVVLIDPATNTWKPKIGMEMKSPSVQVLLDRSADEEVIDTLHEIRVAIVEALEKVCVYLPDYQPTIPDKPKLLDA
jgi:hypothetical protein